MSERKFRPGGTAVFTATDGFTEDFLEYCLKNAVGLKNITSIPGGIRAEIPVSRYILLKGAAKKSGVRLKTVGIGGMPVILSFLRKRVGVFIGLALAALLLMRLTGGIWRIEVRGNETVSRDELLSCLQKCGVDYGTRRKDIVNDEKEQALSVMLEDRVHWLSLNIEGSTALLEIKEKPKADEYVPFGSPCNVIADFDGVLQSLSVTGGKAVIREGSAVKTGDLIISGIIENSDGTTSFYEASGICTARHTKRVTVDIGQGVLNEPTDKKAVVTLRFFDLRLPICFHKRASEGENSFAVELFAQRNGVSFPIGVKKEIFCHRREITPDEGVARLLSWDEMFRALDEATEETAVLAVSFSEYGGCVIAEMDCIDYIGKQSAVKIDE